MKVEDQNKIQWNRDLNLVRLGAIKSHFEEESLKLILKNYEWWNRS